MWFPTDLPQAVSYLLLGISGVVLLVIMDFILGVAEAIKKKEFNWKYLLDFLHTNVFPYVIVWGTFGSIPVLMMYWEFPEIVTKPLSAFVTVAYAFIVAEIVSSIWRHVKEIGFPVKTEIE